MTLEVKRCTIKVKYSALSSFANVIYCQLRGVKYIVYLTIYWAIKVVDSIKTSFILNMFVEISYSFPSDYTIEIWITLRKAWMIEILWSPRKVFGKCKEKDKMHSTYLMWYKIINAPMTTRSFRNFIYCNYIYEWHACKFHFILKFCERLT